MKNDNNNLKKLLVKSWIFLAQIIVFLYNFYYLNMGNLYFIKGLWSNNIYLWFCECYVNGSVRLISVN